MVVEDGADVDDGGSVIVVEAEEIVDVPMMLLLELIVLGAIVVKVADVVRGLLLMVNVEADELRLEALVTLVALVALPVAEVVPPTGPTLVMVVEVLPPTGPTPALLVVVGSPPLTPLVAVVEVDDVEIGALLVDATRVLDEVE